eukprot:c11330_g1_i1.p1 GENE.c11330_g1_i1~~c11330_g1_i1.p1  ORF type:complete len:831 (-),score=228.37 c11330_g1_i1:206-2671(-)
MEKYLTGLSPLLDECVVHMDKLGGKADLEEATWRGWVSSVFLFALHDGIQAHLKDCARCRFQSKIPPVKAGAGSRKSTIPAKPLTAMEMGSLCELAIKDVTGHMENFISTEISSELQKIRESMVKVRPSIDEETFLENFSSSHSAPTLENLRAVVEETSTRTTLYSKKLPLVDQVQEQERLIETLRVFYKDRVLPMAKVAKATHAISNSKHYVIVPETFVDMVNDKIADINLRFKEKVENWENDTGKPFEIDGKRWNELADMTLLGPNALESGRQLRPESLIDPDDSVSAVGTKQRTSVGGSTHSPVRLSVSSTQKSRSPSPNRQTKAPASPVGATPEDSHEPNQDILPGLPVTQPPLLNRQPPNGIFAKLLDKGLDGDDDRAPKISTHKNVDAVGTSIDVCVRIRPLVSHERRAKHKQAVKPTEDGQSIHLTQTLSGKQKTHELSFATVCDGGTTQASLYDKVGAHQLVVNAMNGYCCTCFAYGQTGSGKTFSMAGPIDVLGLQANAQIAAAPDIPPLAKVVLDDMLHHNLSLQGLMPQMAFNLFAEIARQEKANPNVRFFVRTSYVEIYNERVQDLLTTKVESLQVREDTENNSGFFVEGLTYRECLTLPDLLGVFVSGTQNRMVTAHEMNSESSRSHAILSICVEKMSYDAELNTIWVKKGKLSLVDLAGSESVKLTKTAGQALQETAGINKSLLALSNVISSLADKAKRDTNELVTFRNSKLTMLLMDSLVGAGITMMLACCSPSEHYLTETLSTLQFATKAANISKKAVNTLSPHEAEVMRLKQQIDALKAENATLRDLLTNNNIDVPADILAQQQ